MPAARLGAELVSTGAGLLVEGDLVGQRARDIAQEIMFQCRRTPRASTLVIDVSGVQRIDLTGVRALVTANRCANARGIALEIDHPSEHVRDALLRGGAILTIND